MRYKIRLKEEKSLKQFHLWYSLVFVLVLFHHIFALLPFFLQLPGRETIQPYLIDAIVRYAAGIAHERIVNLVIRIERSDVLFKYFFLLKNCTASTGLRSTTHMK
jgi:hypothetical protein